jgi:hypothetical protein
MDFGIRLGEIDATNANTVKITSNATLAIVSRESSTIEAIIAK